MRQAVIAHMASSSSGFYQGQQYHLDLVRLGTTLYSFEADHSAARWLSRISAIKQVRSPSFACGQLMTGIAGA